MCIASKDVRPAEQWRHGAQNEATASNDDVKVQ